MTTINYASITEELPNVSPISLSMTPDRKWQLSATYDPEHSSPSYTLHANIAWSWERGGMATFRYTFWHDGVEWNVYRDEEFEEARQALIQHEGEEAEADWCETHWPVKSLSSMGYPYAGHIMDKMEKTWGALLAIVNPTVTY